MRVLLAHDGSPSADNALRLVADLPWPQPSHLTVVSVIDHAEIIGAAEGAIVMAPSASSDHELVDGAQQLLETAAKKLRGPGRDVDTRLEWGRPASVIVELANDLAMDLVVVGSRGLGPWSSLLLGSVSTEVVDHAPCPVLVARHDRVERLVVATDGSIAAQRAIDTVSQWKLFVGLPALALSVSTGRVAGADWGVGLAGGWMDSYPPQADTGADEQHRLAAQAAGQLREVGISATAVVRIGDASQQIADVAKAEGDLLVMGSRGLGTLERLVLGSVARKVLQHSNASVLIIREPRSAVSLRAPTASLTAYGV